MEYLLDSNIVIESLQSGTAPILREPGDAGISVVTEAEILRLPGLSVAEIHFIEQLLWTLTRLPVDSVIAHRAAEIGRTRRTKLPDLLIAATALTAGVPLITRNTKDFHKIPGLIVQQSW